MDTILSKDDDSLDGPTLVANVKNILSKRWIEKKTGVNININVKIIYNQELIKKKVLSITGGINCNQLKQVFVFSSEFP